MTRKKPKLALNIPDIVGYTISSAIWMIDEDGGHHVVIEFDGGATGLHVATADQNGELHLCSPLGDLEFNEEPTH